MHAAVVTAFDSPPAYREFLCPTTTGREREWWPTSSPRACTRGSGRRPNGSHYTSSGDLPLVPGIDGVGRDPGRALALLRPGGHHDGGDGRADRHRPAPQRRAARGGRPGGDRGGHEPGHVVLGRAAAADELASPARASWCWARPATPGGWRSRWPSTSAPARSSAAGAAAGRAGRPGRSRAPTSGS